MAVNLAGGCRVSEMREGRPVANGSVRVWNQIGRATGAQAISLRVMEFGPGHSPGIQNGDCDEILYVLGPFGGESAECNGERQAHSATPLDQVSFNHSHPEGVRRRTESATISIDGREGNIGYDTGIYLRPNQTFAINNLGTDSIILISSQCPDPDRQPEFVDLTFSSAHSRAHRPMPVVRLADRAPQPTADRWYRVLVNDELGSTRATQFVGSIPPGRAPDHFHNYEEVLFILKGEGRMWADETSTPISEGSCIYLPKGQVHCVENTGKSELRLLGVFYPAGSPSVRYDA